MSFRVIPEEKFTHMAFLVNRRSGRSLVKIRETTNFWVTRSGMKFRKRDLSEVGTSWPTYHLEDVKAVSTGDNSQ